MLVSGKAFENYCDKANNAKVNMGKRGSNIYS
jgi:hypothetical protein